MDLVQPFLDSILESPGDAGLWAILADWLEERDDPRAELVRLTQSLRHEPRHADFWRRQERVQELLAGGMKPLVPAVVNSVGMELALVPAGSFLMGSPDKEDGHEGDEGPQHCVRLTRPFLLGATTVTQRQYRAVMGRNPARFNSRRQGGPTHPVEQVSFAQVQRFCEALSERPAEKAAGRVYRLPTEAEWEYACRASTTSPYHFGEEATWRDANTDIGSDERKPAEKRALLRTCPVRSYPPNAWGLYEMHGNVWEWCSDFFELYTAEEQVDPRGPASADFRVIRGGGWNSYPHWCRSARRSNTYDVATDHDVGFRVVCDWLP